jgi:hypothetical protein
MQLLAEQHLYTKGANRSRLAAGAIGKLDPWRNRK